MLVHSQNFLRAGDDERSKDREEASPNCLLMLHFTSHELSL
jgi:hypothetical protein